VVVVVVVVVVVWGTGECRAGQGRAGQDRTGQDRVGGEGKAAGWFQGCGSGRGGQGQKGEGSGGGRQERMGQHTATTTSTPGPSPVATHLPWVTRMKPRVSMATPVRHTCSPMYQLMKEDLPTAAGPGPGPGPTQQASILGMQTYGQQQGRHHS
jgi:hypothetical protein